MGTCLTKDSKSNVIKEKKIGKEAGELMLDHVTKGIGSEWRNPDFFWEFWQVIVGFVPEMQHNMTGSYQNSEEQK